MKLLASYSFYGFIVLVVAAMAGHAAWRSFADWRVCRDARRGPLTVDGPDMSPHPLGSRPCCSPELAPTLYDTPERPLGDQPVAGYLHDDIAVSARRVIEGL